MAAALDHGGLAQQRLAVRRVVDTFGEQLAVTSDPASGRRAPLLVAVAAAVAVAATLTLTLGGSRTTPALAIERSGDVVSVRLQDATAGPWQLSQELQAAGIKANVLLAPATPDAVGTWVEVRAPRVIHPPAGPDPSLHDAYDEEAERRRETQRLRGVETDGDVVRIPADYPYELALVAGVTPQPGQPPIYDADGRIPIGPHGPGR